MRFKLARMCGGRVRLYKCPGRRRRWEVLRPRRVPGGVILDWLGVGLWWRWEES